MAKTYKWNLRDGREVTLEAEYSDHVAPVVVDLDGDVVGTGKKEIRKNCKLIAYIDGKRYDSCSDSNFWETIDTRQPGIKRIWGIKNIGFTADRAIEIQEFLNSVIEEGRSEDVKLFLAEREAEKNAAAVKKAMDIIKKAETQQDIPSQAEASRRMRRYNDIMNEGGEGYVPYIISREEYEEAKRIISEYGTKEN